ncbi:helix-turn-helix domain-containing protein [Inquilinus sp.]|uniref:helix-turn-helix domain-containing protein n=1 Tax=Inquilinus sp. TaxID=1932117 RepID=UPI0031D39A76
MNEIAQARQTLNVSQAQLGELLGVTQATISRYETGAAAMPERTRRLLRHVVADRAVGRERAA